MKLTSIALTVGIFLSGFSGLNQPKCLAATTKKTKKLSIEEAKQKVEEFRRKKLEEQERAKQEAMLRQTQVHAAEEQKRIEAEKEKIEKERIAAIQKAEAEFIKKYGNVIPRGHFLQFRKDLLDFYADPDNFPFEKMKKYEKLTVLFADTYLTEFRKTFKEKNPEKEPPISPEAQKLVVEKVKSYWTKPGLLKQRDVFAREERENITYGNVDLIMAAIEEVKADHKKTSMTILTGQPTKSSTLSLTPKNGTNKWSRLFKFGAALLVLVGIYAIISEKQSKK